MDATISRVNRSKESARASYNRLSGWYDVIAGSMEKKYRDWGLEKLSAQAGEKILEIGFGTGHCLVSLAKAVGPTGRVIGVDISDGMLAIASERLQKEGLSERADLRLGDAANLDFLEAGGYVSSAYKTYIDGIRKKIKENKLEDCIKLLGTLERAEKLNFFKQILYRTNVVARRALPGTARHIVPEAKRVGGQVCSSRRHLRRTPHRPDVLSGVR